MTFNQKIIPASDKSAKFRFKPMPSVVTNQDWAGATTMPIERFRTQHGQWIVFADGHLYARFYDTVKGKRVKVSRRIADKGTFEDANKNELLKDFMDRVNEQQRSAWAPRVEHVATVAEFFVNHYLPALKAGEAAWATMNTYERTWKQYCAEFFKEVPLISFSTREASAFLRSLARKELNRSTINTIKGCIRGAFRYAVSEELRKDDPFEKASIFGVKVKPKPKHVAYTKEEIKKVVAALPNVRSKLLFSLCSRLGLRPGEAAGLRWGDIDWEHKRGCVLHIRRSCPAGHEQETAKTQGSERLILLSAFPDIMALIEKHRAKCKGDGYLFKRSSGKSSGKPINASKYCSDVIAEKACAAIGKERWRGLYAGRRAMVTLMVKLSNGDTTAASATAGHQNKGTTDDYIELLSEDGFDGQIALGKDF